MEAGSREKLSNPKSVYNTVAPKVQSKALARNVKVRQRTPNRDPPARRIIRNSAAAHSTAVPTMPGKSNRSIFVITVYSWLAKGIAT